MKNWVISENKNIVYRVGELIIQITTLEYVLEQIYNEYILCELCRKRFSRLTFGRKIEDLSKIIKLGKALKTRLIIVKNFRDMIVHEAIEYNPTNKQVYIKSENISNELDEQFRYVAELLTDLHIVLLCVKNPQYKSYKEVIRN